jgi:hypothetical protein
MTVASTALPTPAGLLAAGFITSAPFVHGVKTVTKKELRARPRGNIGRGGR